MDADKTIDETLCAAPGTPAAMDELGVILADLALAEDEVLEAERVLDNKRKVVQAILCNTLPAAMAAAAIEELTRPDGRKIKLKEVVKASIKGRETEAFNWLESNGKGYLIKRKISVQLERGKSADSLKQAIEQHGATPEETLKVEPSTLRAAVTDWMEEGMDFPRELFGAEKYTIARISK